MTKVVLLRFDQLPISFVALAGAGPRSHEIWVVLFLLPFSLALFDELWGPHPPCLPAHCTRCVRRVGFRAGEAEWCCRGLWGRGSANVLRRIFMRGAL